MSGAYRIEAGTLKASQLATTDMGCEQGLMAQDQWVAGLFDGASIALDGNTLTLARNGVTVTLLDRVVADPDRPLLGTRWVVDGLISGAVAQSVPAGATAALTFHEASVDIETGCNSGSATATVANASIAFGPITMTAVPAPPTSWPWSARSCRRWAERQPTRSRPTSLTLEAGGNGLMLRAAP